MHHFTFDRGRTCVEADRRTSRLFSGNAQVPANQQIRLLLIWVGLQRAVQQHVRGKVKVCKDGVGVEPHDSLLAGQHRVEGQGHCLDLEANRQ
jgi:hypothetical protein